MTLKSIDFLLTGGLPILMHFSVIFGRFSNANILLPKRKSIFRRDEERDRYVEFICASLFCVYSCLTELGQEDAWHATKTTLTIRYAVEARPIQLE